MDMLAANGAALSARGASELSRLFGSPSSAAGEAGRPAGEFEAALEAALGEADQTHPEGHGAVENAKGQDELEKTFQEFVGKMLYGQLLKAMRKTQNEPAYFHGGQAERMFQQQLDQVMVDKLSESESKSLAESMYELFTLQRQSG